MTPIIILCGEAGSGKDTIAGEIAKQYNATCIALVDPMKRFTQSLFDFTDKQLWGPSECRNTPDPRYDNKNSVNWHEVEKRLWPGVHQLSISLGHKILLDYRNLFSEWTFLLKSLPRLTPRAVLQTLGTDLGRGVSRDKNIWLNYGLKVADKLLCGGYSYDRKWGPTEDKDQPGPDYVIITDGRFRNEILGVLKIGGCSIKIVNPAGTDGATEQAGIQGHQSERELKSIPDSFYSIKVTNDKELGLSYYKTYKVHAIMNKIKGIYDK